MSSAQRERHYSQNIGWLRAAVLGANDGIVSTASLVVGVAAASALRSEILIAGVAGLVAGAMSMAAGEYVSVSSQADSERSDLLRETEELKNDKEYELDELAKIYRGRGLKEALSKEVAKQLMDHDALGAHARDELGITEALIFVPEKSIIPVVVASALLLLAVMGALAAKAGGAPKLKAAIRVTFWGAFAMGLTAGVGVLLGTHV
jgi:VIT1/CCC1 family predicted Fe2+/Mn2+ transporter